MPDCGDCRDCIDCPSCPGCTTCPPPGGGGLCAPFDYKNLWTGGLFYSWVTKKVFPYTTDSINSDGTLNVVLRSSPYQGEFFTANAKVAKKDKEVRDYLSDRDTEYLPILSRHMHDVDQAWKTAGKSFPKNSYTPDENSQPVFMPALHVDLDCPAIVLDASNPLHKLHAIFSSARGWSNVDASLLQPEKVLLFVANRAQYCSARDAGKAAADLEYKNEY